MAADLLYYTIRHLPVILLVTPVVVWMWLNFRTARQWRAVLMPLTVLALAGSALVAIAAVPRMSLDEWPASRLALPVAWARLGEPLYPGPESDRPGLVRMYGPIATMVYAPAALGTRPAAVLFIGAAINFLCFALPSAWFLWRVVRAPLATGTTTATTTTEAPPKPDPWWARSVAAAFVLCCAAHPVLLVTSITATIDGPAIGFALCACALLAGRTADRVGAREALLCGLFVSLSVWTKQTMWPVAGAVAAYLLLLGRPRAALVMCATVAAVSAGFLLAFGPRALLFDMFTVPSRHPWAWSWMSRGKALLHILRLMPHEFTETIRILLVAILLDLRLPPRPDTRRPAGGGTWWTATLRGIRAWVERTAWLLPLLMALAVVPTCAMAYIKWAGNLNNIAHPTALALLAAHAALFSAGARRAAASATITTADVEAPDRDEGADTTPLAFRARLARLVLVAVVVAMPLIYHRKLGEILPHGFRDWTRIADTKLETAFRLVRQHPGEVHFPEYPLAALLADGQAQHYHYGLLDLKAARLPISDAKLRAGLPPKLQRIIFNNPLAVDIYLERLTEFDRITRPTDLPHDWQVLSRGTGAPATSSAPFTTSE